MDVTPTAVRTSFWHRFFRAYGFALAVALVGVIPGCNFAYSGHGGLFWFVLPFGLPYALVRTALWWHRATGRTRELYAGFAFSGLAVYLALAVPVSALAAMSIEHTFGLPVGVWQFYGVMTVPFSLVFVLLP
jgi:hypothetical protein